MNWWKDMFCMVIYFGVKLIVNILQYTAPYHICLPIHSLQLFNSLRYTIKALVGTYHIVLVCILDDLIRKESVVSCRLQTPCQPNVDVPSLAVYAENLMAWESSQDIAAFCWQRITGCGIIYCSLRLYNGKFVSIPVRCWLLQVAILILSIYPEHFSDVY